MKRLFFFLPVFFYAVLLLASDAVHQTFSSNSGEQLFIDLETGGGIDITGWTKNEVSVTADHDCSDEEDCNLEIKKTPSGVSVLTKYIRESGTYTSNFHFDISVPQKYNIQIQSAGGAISIRGVQGKFDGETGGGKIVMRDTRGAVSLSTGGGQILLENSNLDGEVSTGGGSIVLRNVHGSVQTRTGGGKIIREASFTDGSSSNDEEPVHIETGGGRIELQDAPFGADVSTGGGDIRIHSAKKFVSASTGGGDIQIDSFQGEMEATTGAGNIVVGAANDSRIDLTSGTGDITVTLPSSFSGEIYIKAAYTRDHREAQIVSDFPLNYDQSREWSDKEGTPRKYVYGKANLGSGSGRIHVSTVNGNVYLKKR
jgi:DUF4097 and DUF4098 domain-containing protein YvlB